MDEDSLLLVLAFAVLWLYVKNREIQRDSEYYRHRLWLDVVDRARRLYGKKENDS